MLTDFGIARLLTANTQLTSTGTFTATLAYASPEQLSGVQVDHRSDQYSLACTLFALLAGQAPFAGTDPGQVVAGHLAKPVPPLVRPDVHPQLNAVIARAMAKNPAERFANTGEFAAAALHAVSAPVATSPPFQLASAPHPGWGAPQHFGPPVVPQQGWAAPGLRPMAPMRNAWPAACAMAFAFFAALLVPSAVSSTTMPSIQRDLYAGVAELSWLSTAALLCATVPLVFSGRLGDRFGPRNIYLIGVALFILGSLACLVAPGIRVMVAATAVQGLGVALIIPQTMAVIVRVFPPGRRGAALGLWAGCGAFGALLAPAVGAVLVMSFSWRWVFLLAVPFGLIMTALGATLVPALPLRRPRADPVGVLLSGTGVLLMALGLQRGIEHGWTIWGPVLIGGLVVFGLFLVVQANTGDAALIPKAVLRDRNWWVSILLTLAVTACLDILLTVIALHLQAGEGFSVETAALLLVPGAMVTAILSPIFGNVAERTHPAVFPAIGFASAAAAAVAVTAVMGLPSPALIYAMIGAVLGFALACLWGALATLATRTLPPEHSGPGAGIYLTIRNLGSLIGITIVSTVINSGTWAIGPSLESLDNALREAGLVAAAVLVACALVTALFTHPHQAPALPAHPVLHH